MNTDFTDDGDMMVIVMAMVQMIIVKEMAMMMRVMVIKILMTMIKVIMPVITVIEIEYRFDESMHIDAQI